MFTPEILQFIKEHSNDNIRTLALQAKKYPTIEMPTAIYQIAGRQTAKEKIPLWHETDGILYPHHRLSLEQCSSETTARYKESLIEGKTLVDLTGGLGVDCAFMSTKFEQVTYVEQQTELCRIARHNFLLLGLNHIHIINENAITYLEQMEKVDCIFIDPARRNQYGGKTISISDCEPDIKRLSSLLLEKAETVIIKLSPMLDLSLALQDLPATKEIHVVSVNNECKELLLILTKTEGNVSIHCTNLKGNSRQLFSFTPEQEQTALCEYASSPQKYIYEPNVSILKAGAYKTIATSYYLKKLHPNSHLYTSDNFISEFPGRIFECLTLFPLNKKELRKNLKETTKANITIRNFPATVLELRKQAKLNEGGHIYLFATTLKNEKKVILKCIKATGFI